LLAFISIECVHASIEASKLTLMPSSLSLRKNSVLPTGRLQLEPLSLRLASTKFSIPAESFPLRLRGGAKSKNHTNHNQNRKAHRNGIKRVKTHRFTSMKERDVKVWRNERYARKGSMRVFKQTLDSKKALARGKKPFATKFKGVGKAERDRKARVRNGGDVEEEDEEERDLYRSPSSFNSEETGDDDDDDEDEEEE